MTKSELYLNVIFHSVSRQAFGKDVQFSLPGVRRYATISGIAVRLHRTLISSVLVLLCFGFHFAIPDHFLHFDFIDKLTLVILFYIYFKNLY